MAANLTPQLRGPVPTIFHAGRVITSDKEIGRILSLILLSVRLDGVESEWPTANVPSRVIDGY